MTLFLLIDMGLLKGEGKNIENGGGVPDDETLVDGELVLDQTEITAKEVARVLQEHALLVERIKKFANLDVFENGDQVELEGKTLTQWMKLLDQLYADCEKNFLPDCSQDDTQFLQRHSVVDRYEAFCFNKLFEGGLSNFVDAGSFKIAFEKGINLAVFDKELDKKKLDQIIDQCSDGISEASRLSSERLGDNKDEFFNRILTVWKDPKSKNFFLDVFTRRAELCELAADSPRMIDDEDFKNLGVNLNDPKDILFNISRFKLLFLYTNSIALKGFAQEVDIETPFYRLAYIFAQAATALSKKLSRINMRTLKKVPIFDVKSPAPSLMFFDKESANLSEVEDYINLNLFMLMPNKEGNKNATFTKSGKNSDCVNEDFILFDLMILAEEFGLFEKYKDYFLAIFYRRKAQALNNVIFNPKASGDKSPDIKTLIDIISLFVEKNKRLPDVISFGEGGCRILEQLLSKNNLCESINGIDIDKTKEFEPNLAKIVYEDGSVSLRAGVKDKIVEDKFGRVREASDLMPTIFENLPEADIALAVNVFHETDNFYRYADNLYKKLRPGGYMFIIEPYYCRAFDRLTERSTLPYDSTKFPQSMPSLEMMLDLLAHFERDDGKTIHKRSVPGVWAGDNDSMWRIVSVVYKPIADEVILQDKGKVNYKMPDESSIDWDAEIEDDMDIFRVYPLNKVEEGTDRLIILNLLKESLGHKKIIDILVSDNGNESGRKIKYGEIKKMVIKWLLPKEKALYEAEVEQDVFLAEDSAAERCINDHVPLRWQSIQKEMCSFGDLPHRKQWNRLAGEVRALQALVQAECGVDIRLGSNWE
ncbi:MAG: hypothetical protein WC806_00880 [Candidatus Gracilibacteria bacterium]